MTPWLGLPHDGASAMISTNVATASTLTIPAAEVDSWSNHRTTAQATRAAKARASSGRRRHIDPATCERDYSEIELEFMQAMQQYKQSSGRMFPTWSEVLEVLQSLGYRKPASFEVGQTATAESV
jgi:hypothetical protein